MASWRIMKCSKLRIFFFFLQNLAIFETLIATGPQFPCLFIFGDSFVDNGNNNFLQTPLKANYSPYGIDFPAGPTGRATNGLNVADFIAKKLGFKNFIPPFAGGRTQHILQGLNYGSGAGGILNETGAQFGVLSLSDQLRNHEGVTIPRIKRLLGGNILLRSCLYYVGIGTNDYIQNYFPQFYNSSTNSTPAQFASLLISQYSNQLRRLYNDGARKVAVVGVGDVGCIPLVTAAYGPPGNSSSCVETANNIVGIFNRGLKLLVSTLNRDFPLARFVYARDTALSPDGGIENESEACCLVGGGLCIEGSVPCSNRDEYRFWDGIHPTEVATAAAAVTAYNDISLLFAAHSF